MKVIAFIIITVVWIISSYILRRKRKNYIKQFDNFIKNTAFQLFNNSKAEIERLNKSINRLNKNTTETFKRKEELTAIAETVIYTKRKIITYFDPKSESFYYLQYEPEFLAKGIEIDTSEFIPFLESKKVVKQKYEYLDTPRFDKKSYFRFIKNFNYIQHT